MDPEYRSRHKRSMACASGREQDPGHRSADPAGMAARKGHASAAVRKRRIQGTCCIYHEITKNGQQTSGKQLFMFAQYACTGAGEEADPVEDMASDQDTRRLLSGKSVIT